MINHGERSGQPYVGFAELLARMEGDRDLLRDLLEIFNQEFPRSLRSLQEAVASADANGVEASAHSLKGMMATLAFSRATEIARQLEEMGRQGTYRGAPDRVAELEREAMLAVAELESFCAGSSQ